ncbi:MAG: hypothetical protein KGS10_04250 [Chloroflexi bacterium]|nr:hypothetical protein [Chloroflexota bacterium]
MRASPAEINYIGAWWFTTVFLLSGWHAVTAGLVHAAYWRGWRRGGAFEDETPD